MTVTLQLESNYLLIKSDQADLGDSEIGLCLSEFSSLTVKYPQMLVIFDFLSATLLPASVIRSMGPPIKAHVSKGGKVAFLAQASASSWIKQQGLDALFACFPTLKEALGAHAKA